MTYPSPTKCGAEQSARTKRDGLRVLGLVALLNLVLFWLFFSLATPSYETNDDLSMQMIASGFYTGQPSEYLVFTSVLIGWMLRLVYGIWNGHNWYCAYLIAAHYLALTGIGFVVLSRRRSFAFLSLYTAFFMLVETRILLNLQFTTTAFFAGSAGVLLLVDGLQPGLPVNWPKVVAGLGFTSLMIMIREPVALLLAVIACPFLIERFGWAGWRRAFVAALVCIVLFLGLAGINRCYYQRDPAWAEFLEYNNLRGKIHLTPLSRFIPEVASEVGWSQNDGHLFSSFYFNDPEVYASLPRMRLLYGQLHAAARQQPAPRPLPKRWFFLSTLFHSDAATVMNLAILNAIWCLFAAGRHRGRCSVTLVLSYALCLILSVYLWKTARLPDRVAFNMPLFIHAMCLYWATGFPLQSAAVPRASIFEMLLAILRRAGLLRLPAGAFLPLWIALYASLMSDAFHNFRLTNAVHRDVKEAASRVFEPVQTMLASGKKPVLIPLPLDSILEQAVFFHPSPQKIPFFLVPYGWLAHSPLFYEILDQHQLQPYSRALVDRPDVFFLMESRWIEPLRTYYQEHYGTNICFDSVLSTDEMPGYLGCNLHLFQAHTTTGTAASGVGSSL